MKKKKLVKTFDRIVADHKKRIEKLEIEVKELKELLTAK